MDFTVLLIVFMLSSVASGTMDEITYKKFRRAIKGSATRAHLNIISQLWMYTRFILFSIATFISALNANPLPYALKMTLGLMLGGNVGICVYDIRHRVYDDTFGSMLKRGLRRLARTLAPRTSPALSPA